MLKAESSTYSRAMQWVEKNKLELTVASLTLLAVTLMWSPLAADVAFEKTKGNYKWFSVTDIDNRAIASLVLQCLGWGSSFVMAAYWITKMDLEKPHSRLVRVGIALLALSAVAFLIGTVLANCAQASAMEILQGKTATFLPPAQILAKSNGALWTGLGSLILAVGTLIYASVPKQYPESIELKERNAINTK